MGVVEVDFRKDIIEALNYLAECFSNWLGNLDFRCITGYAASRCCKPGQGFDCYRKYGDDRGKIGESGAPKTQKTLAADRALGQIFCRATLTWNRSNTFEWIRHCKWAGRYEQGKLLYEKCGLNPNNLLVAAMVNVEEDCQVCVRMLARDEGKGQRRKAKIRWPKLK